MCTRVEALFWRVSGRLCTQRVNKRDVHVCTLCTQPIRLDFSALKAGCTMSAFGVTPNLKNLSVNGCAVSLFVESYLWLL